MLLNAARADLVEALDKGEVTMIAVWTCAEGQFILQCSHEHGAVQGSTSRVDELATSPGLESWAGDESSWEKCGAAEWRSRPISQKPEAFAFWASILGRAQR